MKKAVLSRNIPEHSAWRDIEPDAAWLDGFSVESLDAFIKGNAGEVSYGLEAGHMYDWMFMKQSMRNPYTKEDGEQIPARLVLTWREVRTGFEATSNIYVTAEGVEEWLAKVYKRTNGRICDGLPAGVNLNLVHALNWLSTHPISLAWDYVNDSSRPYITFKWINNGDKDEHGRNKI